LLYTRGAAKFSRKPRPQPLDEPEKHAEDEGKETRSRLRRNGTPEIVFGPIEGAETLPLLIDRHRASGTLPISSTEKDFDLWCQVVLIDGSGQVVHSSPAHSLIGAPKPASCEEKEGTGLTLWGEVVDPDGDCELKMISGDLACAVPGTLHDLNVDIDKNNGPRVVQEVEGNFIAQVKVTGSFQPGTVRTGPKRVPYNGGGIVVWQDSDN
jgi:hypothetical protein